MSYRVMVVDDDGNTRHALGALLEMEGYSVEVCSDATSALDRLHAHPYRALVTDYVMPKMDGLELVREARALQPEIRCYVLTGRSQPDCELHGAVWLSKPIELESLLNLLDADSPARRQESALAHAAARSAPPQAT